MSHIQSLFAPLKIGQFFHLLTLCFFGFFSEKIVAQLPCTVEASMSIVIKSAPAAGFTVSANGLAATFQNTSTGGTTYLWNFGDGQTSTDQNPTHNFSAPGNYTVVLTATNDCGSKTFQTTVVVMSTGTSEISALRSLKIYPNPIFGEAATATLDLQAFENEPFTIILTDLAGRAVFSKTVQVFSQKATLEMGELARGAYFVQVFQHGKMAGIARLLRM